MHAAYGDKTASHTHAHTFARTHAAEILYNYLVS